MYIVFLIEDYSGEVLIRRILEKYKVTHPDIEYRICSFKGIGNFPKKMSYHDDIKTRRILNDLPQYLRGFSKQLYQIENSAIFVVLDNDKRCCVTFKTQLLAIEEEYHIQVPVAFCIAIEEMEAWLFGDREALQTAYPTANRRVLDTYEQDGIVDTWELMADAIYPGGLYKLMKRVSSYSEIGKMKSEWADNIGTALNLERNESPSFKYLIRKLDELCS